MKRNYFKILDFFSRGFLAGKDDGQNNSDKDIQWRQNKKHRLMFNM